MAPATRRLIAPGIATLVVFAILIGLGVWQIERLAWKEALIAAVESRVGDPPIPAPGPSAWPALDLDAVDYTPVTVSGTFHYPSEVHLYATVSEPKGGRYAGVGWFIYTPLKTDEGWWVYVNRGFVPDDRKSASTRREGQVEGRVTVTGLLRRPETPWRILRPGSNGSDNQWFYREPARFGEAHGLSSAELAPYTIEADATPNPGGLPQGGETRVTFPNNHLNYAITWFALAAGLLAVFGIWARGIIKGDEPKA